jgi:hypothetical protein
MRMTLQSWEGGKSMKEIIYLSGCRMSNKEKMGTNKIVYNKNINRKY